MARKLMWGVAAVAALALAVFAVRGFPSIDNTQGAIGAAKRYNGGQLAPGDVKLGDATAQAFLQSDTFAKLLKDPAALKLLADPNVRRALADPEVATALTDEAFRAALKNPEFAAALGRYGPQCPNCTRQFLDPQFYSALQDKAFVKALQDPQFIAALQTFGPTGCQGACKGQLLSPDFLTAIHDPALVKALQDPQFIASLQKFGPTGCWWTLPGTVDRTAPGLWTERLPRKLPEYAAECGVPRGVGKPGFHKGSAESAVRRRSAIVRPELPVRMPAGAR